MINLNQNTDNIVIFTLYEKSIGDNPYMLELYSNQNKTSTFIKLTGDTSGNVLRYNQYIINPTPLNLISGGYDYRCHQYTGGTATLSASTNIVESGKCEVIGTGTTTTTFENNNGEYTFI